MAHSCPPFSSSSLSGNSSSSLRSSPLPLREFQYHNFPSPPPSLKLPPSPLRHLISSFHFFPSLIPSSPLSSPSPPPLLPFSPPQVFPPAELPNQFNYHCPCHCAISPPWQQNPCLENFVLKGNAYPRLSSMREKGGGFVQTCFLGCKWSVVVVV